jgi:hypothetical protein
MAFDRKRKSVRRFVPLFFKCVLPLEPVKRAVDLDGGETLRAEPEPLFLRRVAVEIVAPAFVIPPAGADVCFAGHCIKDFEAQWLRTLVARRALAVVSAMLSGGAKGSKCAADSARYSIWLHHGAKTPHDFLQAPGDLA